METFLIFDTVHDTTSKIENISARTIAELEKTQNEYIKNTIKILDWLTPMNYHPQQRDYFQRQQPGTWRWLLDSEKFQSWWVTRNQTLFCPGVPGAGKTILTSIVVDYLFSKFCDVEHVGIAYIYCNYYRYDEQNTSDLLASILKQLAENQRQLPEIVKDLYRRHESGRTRPSVDELYTTLRFIITQHSRVFIIIDSLDECQTSNDSWEKTLSHLFKIQAETGINIFATSRPIPEVYEKFKESTVIEVLAHNDDIREYLESQISQSHLTTLNINREDIITSITGAADGM